MSRIYVDGRIDSLPVEPQRVVREIAQELNAYAGRIFVGAGSPETKITAVRGSLYLRTDGGAGTTLYIKEANDTLATGWAAK